MRVKRLFGLWLAVALLTAWQAALQHPLTHGDVQRGFVHVASAPVSPAPDGDRAVSLRCEILAAVAVLVGNAPRPAMLQADGCAEVPHAPFLGAHASFLLAYRSQAPPARS